MFFLLFSFANASLSKTIFFDDFEGELSEEWNGRMGTVGIIKDPDDSSNHVLEVNPNAAAEAYCYAMDYIDLTDYTIEAKVRSLGGFGTEERVGLIARGTNNASFYQLELTIDLGLFEINDPSEGWGRVESLPADVESNVWYDVKFTCEGAHLMGYINGEKIIDVVDKNNPHLNGFFGMRTWSGHPIYDNYEIYDKGGSSRTVEAFGKLASAWGEIKIHY
jgi:hypothetical protein